MHPLPRLFGVLSIGAAVSALAWAPAANADLTQAWRLNAGDRTYLTGTGDFQRGISYNPVTGHLLIAARTSGSAGSIAIVNGSDGSDTGTTLNVTGVSGGTFLFNQIAVAGDGAIYASNLSGSTSAAPAFKIYRWANESAAPTVVYSGDPFGAGAFGRIGDDLDVTGSGTGTIIAAGRGTSGDPSQVLLFTTADGTNFTAVPNSPPSTGNYRAAVAFGASGELYGKENGDTIRRGTYTAAGIYTEVNSYANGATLPSAISAIGVDATNHFLVGLNSTTAAGGAKEARLYDITDTSIPPVFIDAKPIGSTNANANLAGSVDFDPANKRVFVLDTNNGITAYNVSTPEPGTVGLLGAGVAAYLFKRRRA